jgi:ankyrin repeat domain-containing protein 50
MTCNRTILTEERSQNCVLHIRLANLLPSPPLNPLLASLSTGLTMAELGILSGAVGLVSFGIQITQGLLEYYGSWKDQDTDVSDMCASLDSLLRALTILRETKQRHATSSMQVENSVEEIVNRVDEAMKKLDDELRKVRGTEYPKPGGMRAAMRRHVRRALYPFKEQTLRKIQQVVSEARSNLGIALQVLQVFVYLEFVGVVLQ